MHSIFTQESSAFSRSEAKRPHYPTKSSASQDPGPITFTPHCPQIVSQFEALKESINPQRISQSLLRGVLVFDQGLRPRAHEVVARSPSGGVVAWWSVAWWSVAQWSVAWWCSPHHCGGREGRKEGRQGVVSPEG
jgi:hypothetical protein